jgi:hypothetical protein
VSLSLSLYSFPGTLSVTRAAFESFITEHGGTVAKTVTNSVTHLVSAETGTKKCQDAEAKGVTIVDEAWVRKRVNQASGSSGSGSKNKEPKEASFTPRHDFVEELIATDEDEGRPKYEGGKQ